MKVNSVHSKTKLIHRTDRRNKLLIILQLNIFEFLINFAKQNIFDDPFFRYKIFKHFKIFIEINCYFFRFYALYYKRKHI